MLIDGISTLKTRSPQVVLEPNETYWNPDRKPAVRIIYDNAVAREDAIRSVAAGDGRVDVVMDLTVEEARAFDGNGHGKVQTKPAKTVLVGVFNEGRKAHPRKSARQRYCTQSDGSG